MFGFGAFGDRAFGDAPIGTAPSSLYLRNTTANGISIGGVPCYDLSTTPGSSPDTAVTDTTNGGTEIQFTKTAGGSVAAFITGRVPAGGWTITSSDVALWLQESASTVNAGLRFRLFKYSGGTETELGGSPFDTGTEFNTANTLETLVGNLTPTTLAEDDRLLLRIYAVNVGTMAVGTATLNFNGDTIGAGSPTVTYIASASMTQSGSTSTATAASIGAANTNRRVIVASQNGTASGRTLTSATIGGISATIHAQCTDSGSGAGAYIFSAVVPTGTTADIVMTFSSTLFSSGWAHVYTTDDTTVSSTVNTGTNTTASATSIGVNYTSTTDGFSIGCTDWNNGSSKTPVTVTGYTADIANSDEAAFHRAETSGTSQTATTAWSGSFGAASAVASFAPASTTTYGNSYLNVYPAVTFKAEGSGVTGSGATSQAQTSNGTGSFTPAAVTAAGASSQAQTSAGSGTHSPAAITATGSTSQAQTSGGTGTHSLGVDGVGSTSQAQTASGSGSFTLASVSGSGSTSQAQTSAGSGTHTVGAVTGTGNASQAQTSSGSGTHSPQAVTGGGTTSQAQSANGTGAHTPPVSQVSIVYGGDDAPKRKKHSKKETPYRDEIERLFNEAEQVYQPVQENEPQAQEIALAPVKLKQYSYDTESLQSIIAELVNLRDNMNGDELERLYVMRQHLDKRRMFMIRARAALLL